MPECEECESQFLREEIDYLLLQYHQCNKHIPVGVSLNGERLIVVHIVIVDYLHSLVWRKSYRYKTGRYKVESLED